MRKIKAMRRNRNNTICYMVIRDGKSNTMELWSQRPDGGPMTAIIEIPFVWNPGGTIDQTEVHAQDRITTCADFLSRSTEDEVAALVRQLQNEYGRPTPRGAEIQTA